MSRDSDSRYVSASGPVNRRTAARGAPRSVNPALQQRLQRRQLQQTLGAPLSRQLAAASAATMADQGLAVASIFSVVGAAILLWPPAGLLALGSGAGLLLSGIASGAWWWKRRQQALTTDPALPWFDAPSLEALDRVLETVAPQLSASTLERLLALKASFVRLAPLMLRGGISEHFTLEDRLYVIECLRRYLPDSLETWLAVPETAREAGGDDAPSAQALLEQQLELMQAELKKREQGLLRAMTEAMEKQQRFLESKRG